MKQFHGRTAVITGAASGFGLEVARLAALQGMQVVMADLDASTLARAEVEIRNLGANTLARRVDVAQAAEVQALADATLERFGVPNLLFNNAGIGSGGLAWENSAEEWRQVMGVNVHGVVNGLRSFVPLMLAAVKQNQDFEAHIVNTASLAGFQSMPLMSLYNASKFAVVGLTETLYHDLALMTDRIGVSLLAPGMVPTNIGKNKLQIGVSPPAQTAAQQLARKLSDQGMAMSKVTAADVARCVMRAVGDGTFYVFSHPGEMNNIRIRAEDQLTGRAPTDPFASFPGVTAYLQKTLRGS
jgi:NAD(P)-dependent dehydrogenase (short-subunit alcohol dehydrogenase family)